MVKRWHILLMIGLAGVLSLLLAPFERLASGQDLSFTIRVVMLVQPAVLIIAAVATGQALAGKTRARHSADRCLAERNRVRASLAQASPSSFADGSYRRPADDRLFVCDPACLHRYGNHGKNGGV